MSATPSAAGPLTARAGGHPARASPSNHRRPRPPRTHNSVLTERASPTT
jgi:hypothetical protein